MKISNEIKIALTAIAAGVLLFLGINFLKGINVFKSSNSYYVRFKDAKGLTVSSKVFANGYPVGTVRDIEYNYDNNSGVVVRIELNENMGVPRGTRSELVEALMGGVTMNLLLGSNPVDNLAPFDTIPGAAATTLMGDAGQMLPDVQRMLPKLDSILTNLNRLSGDPALQQTLTNAAAISENLKTTTAQLDRLMARDVPQLMASLHRTGANAEKFSGEGGCAANDGSREHHAGQRAATLRTAQYDGGRPEPKTQFARQQPRRLPFGSRALRSFEPYGHECRFAPHRSQSTSEALCAFLHLRSKG